MMNGINNLFTELAGVACKEKFQGGQIIYTYAI